MEVERFEQLDVWKRAHALVLGVSSYVNLAFRSEVWPDFADATVGRFGPGKHCRGVQKRGHTDKIRFYNIAQGSLEELRYYFILCRDLRYRVDYNHMSAEAEEVSRMLYGLIRSIERRQQAAR
jgi:23S rRNA-intervening sequence protein